MKIQRPLQHLNSVTKLYPEAGKLVDGFRFDRKGLPDWPDWCFLPMAGWYAIVSDRHNVQNIPPELAGEVSKLAALGTWRYTQGIYRIDKNLFEALVESSLAGKLPSEVLLRLPEWCIYIETPSMMLWNEEKLYGFWVHLEWDPNHERAELRFLLDCDPDFLGFPLHLGDWDIEEAIEKAMAEAERNAKAFGLPTDTFGGISSDLVTAASTLLSIVLYIVSDEPEIDDSRQPGSFPSLPSPKKTKKGWRLFPPDKPRIWNVGVNIGEKLRSQSMPSEATGRTVKTHVRRGHWHSYWIGPRDGKRTLVPRWISPLVVRGSMGDKAADDT